jgi:hypothetical protein
MVIQDSLYPDRDSNCVPPEYRSRALPLDQPTPQAGFEPVLSDKCCFFAVGFLKTGARGSAQGNFGLMDLVAGLHWLRENIPAFGGDPDRITLLGHGTGAALSNIIAVSPVAKGTILRCDAVSLGR